jgi:hypothetical protein
MYRRFQSQTGNINNSPNLSFNYQNGSSGDEQEPEDDCYVNRNSSNSRNARNYENKSRESRQKRNNSGNKRQNGRQNFSANNKNNIKHSNDNFGQNNRAKISYSQKYYRNRNYQNQQQNNQNSNRKNQNYNYKQAQNFDKSSYEPPKKNRRNFIASLIPESIYNPKTKKVFGILTTEDLLLISLILMFLEDEDNEDQTVVYALIFVLVSDWIDLSSFGL